MYASYYPHSTKTGKEKKKMSLPSLSESRQEKEELPSRLSLNRMEKKKTKRKICSLSSVLFQSSQVCSPLPSPMKLLFRLLSLFYFFNLGIQRLPHSVRTAEHPWHQECAVHALVTPPPLPSLTVYQTVRVP